MNSLRRHRPRAEFSIALLLIIIGLGLSPGIGMSQRIGGMDSGPNPPLSPSRWPKPPRLGVVLDRIVDGTFAVYLVGEAEVEFIVPSPPRPGSRPVPPDDVRERIQSKQ